MISSLMKCSEIEHKSSDYHWPVPDSAKFRGNGQTPQHGSKFRSPQKTVVLLITYYCLKATFKKSILRHINIANRNVNSVTGSDAVRCDLDVWLYEWF